MPDLFSQLDATHDALEEYLNISKLMRGATKEPIEDDMDQIALREELEFLARSATESQLHLETICTDFCGFFNRLSYDPKVLSDLNGMMCDADRVQVADLNSCDQSSNQGLNG